MTDLERLHELKVRLTALQRQYIIAEEPHSTGVTYAIMYKDRGGLFVVDYVEPHLKGLSLNGVEEALIKAEARKDALAEARRDGVAFAEAAA